MSWMVNPEAARDTALAVATAIPVVAVAYYTVRGSDSSDQSERAEFDLPTWVRAEPPGKEVRHPRFRRCLRGLISFFGRVPTTKNGFIITEAILFAADAAFVRSFTPGLVAALLAVLTDGNLRWIAVSALLLYGMASQLVVYVTVSNMLRRDAKFRAHGSLGKQRMEAAGSSRVNDPLEPSTGETARPTLTPAGRDKWLKRVVKWVVDFWQRQIATRQQSSGVHDIKPFNVLAFVAALQTLVGAIVSVACIALFLYGHIAAGPAG